MIRQKKVVILRPVQTGPGSPKSLVLDAGVWADIKRETAEPGAGEFSNGRIPAATCRAAAKRLSGQPHRKDVLKFFKAASDHGGATFDIHHEVDATTLPARLAGDVVFVTPSAESCNVTRPRGWQ